jgi:hypothetical protein
MHADDERTVRLAHPDLGTMFLHCDAPDVLAFCDNDTNHARLHGVGKRTGHCKDGLHDYVISGAEDAVNPARCGTKVGAIRRHTIPAGATVECRLRLSRRRLARPFRGFDQVFRRRELEANAFYDSVHPVHRSPEERRIQRQALAGMLWSKQFYYYDVPRWLAGDPGQPTPPPERRRGRNHDWLHLNNADILSMPDTWEYPRYAAWDLALHCIPLALVDPDFAKEQLLLLTREWYMHPNGQLPAYEWALGDVNPPVHAWAAWRVFEMDRARRGDDGDLEFLERVLHKLLLNFTWWVNRKDAAADLIRWSNIAPAPVLALDTPSGVDADTGTVLAPAVMAAATLTLALPKRGLAAPGAAACVGELYLADIGVPPARYAAPPLRLDVGPVFARAEIVRLR